MHTARRSGGKIAHFPHISLTGAAGAVLEEDRARPHFAQRVAQLSTVGKEMECLSLCAQKIKWDAQVIMLRPRPDDTDFETFVNPEVPGYDDPNSVAPMYGMWETDVTMSAVTAWVVRPQQIHVQYQDEFGASKAQVMDGMRARLFMHELDFLKGRSMLNRVHDTDFIQSVISLDQKALWPAAFPSVEAHMTGHNLFFDYVQNKTVVPPGMEWLNALMQAYAEFQTQQIGSGSGPR